MTQIIIKKYLTTKIGVTKLSFDFLNGRRRSRLRLREPPAEPGRHGRRRARHRAATHRDFHGYSHHRLTLLRRLHHSIKISNKPESDYQKFSSTHDKTPRQYQDTIKISNKTKNPKQSHKYPRAYAHVLACIHTYICLYLYKEKVEESINARRRAAPVE